MKKSKFYQKHIKFVKVYKFDIDKYNREYYKKEHHYDILDEVSLLYMSYINCSITTYDMFDSSLDFDIIDNMIIKEYDDIHKHISKISHRKLKKSFHKLYENHDITIQERNRMVKYVLEF